MFWKKKETQTVNGFTNIQKMKIADEMDQKSMNHEFFLLVRDQKYEQALAIGNLYLEYHPENESIRKFCEFIQENKEGLSEMVKDEQLYTDESDDDDEEQEQEDSQDQKESRCSQMSVSSSSKSSVSSQSIKFSASSISKSGSGTKNKKGKQNTQFCKEHKWQHICKQKNCPNKAK